MGKNYSSSSLFTISQMFTFLIATFLVSLLTISGGAAIAYLFPQNHSPD